MSSHCEETETETDWTTSLFLKRRMLPKSTKRDLRASRDEPWEFLLNNCQRVVAVSGTAATEAAWVRPTKIIYHLGISDFILALLLRFGGIRATQHASSDYANSEHVIPGGESVLANARGSVRKRLAQNTPVSDKRTRYFSLVNWLLFQNYQEKEGECSVQQWQVYERLIFWYETRDRFLWQELAKDLVNSKWNNAEEVRRIRDILTNELTVPEEVGAEEIAAREILRLMGVSY